MRILFAGAVVSGLLALSCHKGRIVDPTPASPDTVAVRLKDVDIAHLPSPYYHFEYDNSGKIVQASMSGGLGMYGFVYGADGKILRVENNTLVNKDKLLYTYEDGDCTKIEFMNVDGDVYRRVTLEYESGHRLHDLYWTRKQNGSFVDERLEVFVYYPDGNLQELATHLFPTFGQTEADYTDDYSQYDQGKNVDAFALLHLDQSTHPIIIPALRLQMSNPRKVVHSGTGLNYNLDFVYTYDALGRPLTRISDLVFSNGADAGKHFTGATSYSYYD